MKETLKVFQLEAAACEFNIISSVLCKQLWSL